jgi:hypothetical protein
MSREDPVRQDAANKDLYDVLDITVHNAYPGYDGVVTFYIDNNGTIPLWVAAGDPVITTEVNGEQHSYDKNGNICADVILVTPLVDTSALIYPAQYSAPFTVEISIPQDSNPVQNSTYHVVVPLTATQFLPTPPTP